MSLVKSTRHTRILTELDNTPSLRVAELAQKLSVSTETIRRDLDALTRQGLLNRTYGGAIRPLSSEPPVQERQHLFIAEREQMAAAVLPLIKLAKVLIIGSGATTVHVAHRIALEMKNLTVIAHSFGVAQALTVNPSIKILVLPGNYNAAEATTQGAHTVAFLDHFHADAAILGASGLSSDGPSDALLETGAVYTAMIARAAKTIVVADHSKFSQLFPARYAAWRQISALVTDRRPEGDLLKALHENRVTINCGHDQLRS
ncbi:MAG TPA: DeoR/GlpR family DNA-binding transcription regulator [Acidocella sp.]|nr:MAG: DeoR family transcriptional regulator [Acidocella sp. 20-58-15]HQT37805.1 DeoR/GlpR family DNA-binding transcription regulator [Acidocella sp.]